MANTLNLGNGQWATKEGSLLGYNSENNNYKPLPFDFSRASTATRVNKQGLIETVGANEPRVDYKDDSKGALLLEPQSTNLITYSEDFNAWTKTGNTTISATNIISPSGQNNATLITGLDGTGGNDLKFNVGINTANKTFTFSVYLKGSGTLRLHLSNNIDNAASNVVTLTTSWVRYELTHTFNSTTSTSLSCVLDDSDGSTATEYNVFAAQLEELSYATSYIKTTSAAVTRLADVCNNGGNEQVINSTEGVLYAEISALADDGTKRYISLSDGSNSNDVRLYFDTGGYISALTKVGGSTQAFLQTNAYTQTDFNKIAFKFKENNFSLYVNGIEVATDNLGSVNTANTLNQLAFFGNLLPFYGNVKDVRVYNTALTDQELAALTQV